MEFAGTAWSTWLEVDKVTLEKIQRRAVAMISGLQGSTYEERSKELGLTTLDERRHQADMVQTFKIMQGHDRVASNTWFQRVDVTVRTTRSASDPLNLKQQASRLETRRNFFSNRVPVVKAWNLVPSEIKGARTVNGFKMHNENTERPWCNPPEQDGDGVPGSGGTTPGTRKFLRGPTWTIGIQQPTHTNPF
jgi:hypothetical protein